MSQLTKHLLSDAFVELASLKSLSQITVKDLTEHCEISRMTFYYHFKDIYDLAGWTVKHIVKNAVGDLSHFGDNWQAWYLALGKTAVKHQDLFCNLVSSIRYETVINYLYELTSPILGKIIERFDPEGRVAQKDRKLITDFFKCGFVGMELEWIKSGMKETPEAFTQRMQTLINGQIPLALANFAQPA